MEMIKSNFLNTTTQMTVNTGSLTSTNLFTRATNFQFVSDNFNDDNTTASITISFDETQTVSRLAMMEFNLKAFDIYYDGATANTFAITATGSTNASTFSSNSETSMFMRVTPQACTSVTLDLKTTQVADNEKAIGYFMVSDTHVVFPRVPSAKDYKPIIDPKQIEHKLSDGGSRLHTTGTKRSASIKFKFIETSFRDSLKSVFDLQDEFIFSGFGTMTSWDEFLFPCIWPGKFDFFKFSDNFSGAGHSGKITLKETTG